MYIHGLLVRVDPLGDWLSCLLGLGWTFIILDVANAKKCTQNKENTDSTFLNIFSSVPLQLDDITITGFFPRMFFLHSSG